MIILKAVYENMEPSILKKKIYLEIGNNRQYSFSYVGLLDSKQYETYMDAIYENNFFNKKKEGIYGKLSIEYNGQQASLNVYSDTIMSAHAVELDDKTGWLAVIGVSEETYNLKIQDNKISIFDSKLNFVRHVELKNIKNIMFDGKEFPIERIINVKKDNENDCMICELGFNCEWVAKFKYDMKSGDFKELLLIWRR